MGWGLTDGGDIRVDRTGHDPSLEAARIGRWAYDLGFCCSTDGAGGLVRVRTPPAPYVALLSTHDSEEGTACASARYFDRSWGLVARW